MRDGDERPVNRYLVVLRFESQEQPLDVRIREHVPLIKNALADLAAPMTKIELAFGSKDGSVIGIGVKTPCGASEILAHIHSHGNAPSPTRSRDQILVLEIGDITAIQRVETFDGWLNKGNRH
jgi:hypothetical protein